MITTTAASHDPVAFLGAVADAYRASGRPRPLFDTVGHNPYPLFPDEVPDAIHHVYVGQGDHARLLSMLDESFAGTAQPSTSIWYLENGFQTSVAAWRRSLYAGHESVEGAVSGTRQAEQLGAALRLAYCQPRVTAPARTSVIAARYAANDGFGRQSAQSRPDCQRSSDGSSMRRKLKYAVTRGWQ